MENTTMANNLPENGQRRPHNKNKQERRGIFALLILLVTAAVISLTMGRYGVPAGDIIHIFYCKLIGIESGSPQIYESVLFKVRIPRALAAILIGGALSVSGAAYQGLFKNPMVSPDILGASAGAGFGAAISILWSFNAVAVQANAFLFGIIAVVLSYLISSAVSRGKDAVLILVLTGMVVSALCSAFITLVKYVADTTNKLPEITYWLMGGLSATNMSDVIMMLLPLMAGFIPLMLLRWQLNVMVFGDDEAKTMGIETSRTRLMVIIAATLLTAASVAVAGIIGWIGLVIPHLARMIIGPNYRMLIPASFLLGSLFLLIIDDVARCLLTMEIPLGVLTAIIGAPFFIYLLLKRRKGWV
jgi:iron complex transport system permease protein